MLWTPSNFPWLIFWAFLMTSGGEKNLQSWGSSNLNHRKILTSGTRRKHPNKSGLSKQEQPERKAPGSSVQDLQGPGTHSASCCIVSYWHTTSSLWTSCVCLVVSLSLCQSVCLTVLLLSLISLWNSLLHDNIGCYCVRKNAIVLICEDAGNKNTQTSFTSGFFSINL